MEKKYKLTEETTNVDGITLYRIEALIDFGDVKEGDKGGFVEGNKNLSHEGNCWVYGNAIVCGNARVYGKAEIYGNARVYSNAKVYGNAEVYEDALVYEDAKVCGNAEVWGNAEVCGNATITSDSDYIIFKNWWSSGRFFTWTRSNDMWKVGCFYGTGKELVEKAYKDSELSGREYKRVVDYVESVLKEMLNNINEN